MGLRDLEKLDVDSANYKDSKFIIQLLRDNISVSCSVSVTIKLCWIDSGKFVY